MEIIQERPKIVENNPCIAKQVGYYRGMDKNQTTTAGARTQKLNRDSLTIYGEAHGGYRPAAYHVQHDLTREIHFAGTYEDCQNWILEHSVKPSQCEGHPAGPNDPMGQTVFCDGSCKTVKKVWVVTAPSAYRPMHTCFLGRGATKAAALEDAYGPKADWSNNTRKSMRIADVYETDEATAEELEHGSDE